MTPIIFSRSHIQRSPLRKKTLSEKHFSVEACQLMVCHHRPSSFVFIGLVDHNSMLFCKYKMCTSFMQRPQTGHFCCKHWHEATERININEKCQIHSHLEFHQKEIPLDMLQFTPRGNSPLVKNQSRLNVLGGPGPTRLMGPLSSLWPTWRGEPVVLCISEYGNTHLGPNQGQTWCQFTIYEMELNLL